MANHNAYLGLERQNNVKAFVEGHYWSSYRDLIHFGLVAMRSGLTLTPICPHQTSRQRPKWNYLITGTEYLAMLIESSVSRSLIMKKRGEELNWSQICKLHLFARSLRHLVIRGLLWLTKSIVCSCWRSSINFDLWFSGIREQRRVKSSRLPISVDSESASRSRNDITG